MNIIIEGPDGSGKSTLVQRIAQHVPLAVQPGAGPEQHPGEIVERAWRYLRMDNRLFDRHPIISQPIYGSFRDDATVIPQELIDHLYRSKPLIIYCHGLAPGDHQVKDYDTEEHLAMIDANDQAIRDAYRKWAFVHVPPQFWFDVGSPSGDPEKATQNLINLCKEFCNET